MRLRDRLVHLLVRRYPPQEIPLGHLRRSVLVIRIPRAHFKRDVGGDDSGVIAYRFEKNKLDVPLFGYPGFNSCPGNGLIFGF